MSWNDAAHFRRNNFDVLRLLLALMVVYSHSYPLARGLDAHDALATVTLGQVDGGFLAVNCFFTISGFLIAHSWASRPVLSTYLRKRCLRIYPGFIASMLVVAFVVAPVASRPWRTAVAPWQLLKAAVSTCTLTQYPPMTSTFQSNPLPASINGAVWTIQYEFLCYLMLALVGTAGLLARPRVAAAVLVVLTAGYAVTRSHPGAIPRWWDVAKWWDVVGHGVLIRTVGSLYGWPRLATYFWAGMAFYVCRAWIRHRWWYAAAAAAALVGGVFTHALGNVMPFAATYLIFWFAFHPGIRLDHFGKYGDFSYGTYLYAFPIQQLFVSWVPSIRPLSLFAVAGPLSVLAGVASWYVVERRFVRSKHSQSPGLVTGTSPVPAMNVLTS